MSRRDIASVSSGDEDEPFMKKIKDKESVGNYIDQFNKQMKEQKKIMVNLSKSYQTMSDLFDEFKKEIQNLKKENKSLKKTVSKLDEENNNLNKRMQSAERNILVIKQKSNSNHMVITNLPTFKKDTDIKYVVNKVAQQVEYQIAPNEILDAYQMVNEKNKTKNAPIIVKLNSANFKNACIKFRREKKIIDIKKIADNLKGNDQNINFFHYLEKEYAVLLNKAKVVAKEKQYKYV